MLRAGVALHAELVLDGAVVRVLLVVGELGGVPQVELALRLESGEPPGVEPARGLELLRLEAAVGHLELVLDGAVVRVLLVVGELSVVQPGERSLRLERLEPHWSNY